MRPEDPIFHDAGAATAFLEAMRWPNGPVCPRCRATENMASLPAGDLGAGHRCGQCGARFTVADGTMLARSAIPLPKWLTALRFLAATRFEGSLETALQGVFSPLDADPDLRLLVDGQVVRPLLVEDLVFSFAVPPRPGEVRILSRHFVPARHDPANPDRRRLGVNLSSIVIEAGDAVSEWPHDDLSLVDGFHKLEPGQAWRWTNGRALLPSRFYATIETGFTLKIQLAYLGALYAAGF